jgi:hypothetical protein
MRLPAADDLMEFLASCLDPSITCIHTGRTALWHGNNLSKEKLVGQQYQASNNQQTTIQSANNNNCEQHNVHYHKLNGSENVEQHSLPQAIRIDYLSELVACCIIPLHNDMGISDRVVMGDARETYLPSASVEVVVESEEDEQQEEEVVDNGRIVNNDDIVDAPVDGDANNNNIPVSVRAPVAVNGLNNFNTNLARIVATRDEWQGLKDDIEWDRLRHSLINFKGRSSRTDWENHDE